MNVRAGGRTRSRVRPRVFHFKSRGAAGTVQMHNLKLLWRCRKGATAIEYALLAAIVATAAVAAFVRLGNEVDGSFNRTSNALGASTASVS